MDRRNWLWRRKSSEISPADTQSSGSVSSHSERFSDEQVFKNQNTQSPEVTSKAMVDDKATDDVKSLKEKLVDALSQIRLKEDSVKQHAKVAEEAVSGWEKAENEVLAMRQQLGAVTQKNSALEDRMTHLDCALKECVRQLRQAKEEQDQMIDDAVCKKTQEWESLKSEFQSEVEYHSIQHKNAKAELAAFMERVPDLQSNLDALFTENLNLKLELLSLTDEMKIRISERDYCIQAAETASKQHLESSKKLAKLEAECLRLRSLARKAALFNDNRSATASSIFVESITDNQSDCGDKVILLEADLCKMGILEPKETEPGCYDPTSHAFVPEIGRYENEKAHRQNLLDTHVEIDLMDDFLEMERMVSVPDPESEIAFGPVKSLAAQLNPLEVTLKAELQCMINRAAEQEEKLEYAEALYTEANNALLECQKKLQTSQTKLNKTEEKLKDVKTLNTEVNCALVECQKQLEISQTKSKEYEEKLVELKIQLALTNESRQAAEELAKAANAQKEVAEARLVNVEAEKGSLLVTVRFLEGEIEKERSLSAEKLARCQILEEELSRTKTEVESKEKALVAEYLVKCRNLEDELLKTKAELNQATSEMAREFKVDQEKELEIAAQQFAECQKTIASLGRQLRSLASLEDFILDSEKSLQTSDDLSHSPEQGTDLSDLHSNKLRTPENDSELSISEAYHSSVVRVTRGSNAALSSNPNRASDRSKATLTSRVKEQKVK